MTDTFSKINNRKIFSPPDQWLKIKTIDMHTGGEPLRVIVDGFPKLKRSSSGLWSTLSWQFRWEISCSVLFCTAVLYCSVLMFCTVLYCCTVVFCTAVLYCFVLLYCTVLYSCTVLFSTAVLYCSVLLYCTVMYRCTVLFCTSVLYCYVQLYCTVLYICTVLLWQFFGRSAKPAVASADLPENQTNKQTNKPLSWQFS